MTPVMARCPCEAHYPLAECVTCTPTPPDGRNPDHTRPVQALTPSVDDSGLTLDGPPVAATIAVAATGAAAVVVVAGMAVVAWALGVVIDVLRGEA